MLTIQTLGELTVHSGGEVLPLPASKKTRALLAYLLLTMRPHRRDRLCELFWEVPDDPRGALRWSLSKLRRVVNDAVTERLVADRERVRFRDVDVEIDIRAITTRLEQRGLGVEELCQIAVRLQEPLLDGIDLPNQEQFQSWLTAERQDVLNLGSRVAQRLALHADLPPGQTLRWYKAWLAADPFNTQAGAQLLFQLR